LGFVLWLLAVPVFASEKARPRSDALGDPLPAGAVARLGTVRLRHGDYLRSIRFAPDGKTLISLGQDGVHVWDATTGKPVRHFGAAIVPRSLDLSSDGRRAAISRFHEGSGGPVEVWDLATGKLLHKLGNQHYSQVCFSPDGKQLAARTNHLLSPDFPWSISLWDVESGREIRTLPGPKEHIWDMKFSADGKSLLLGGSGRMISLWSTADGKELRRFRDVPADVHSLALSPSGDRVGFIELWSKRFPGGGTSWGSNVRVCFFWTPERGLNCDAGRRNRNPRPIAGLRMVGGMWHFLPMGGASPLVRKMGLSAFGIQPPARKSS
jgi:WD40 repeat protein